ncbi:hypothetical protein [Campylobacter troglodytis]|nr:hypothetical protein [Campylobacter troglodytis]
MSLNRGGIEFCENVKGVNFDLNFGLKIHATLSLRAVFFTKKLRGNP